LFDQSPDVAFFVKDDAGRYVVVNESLAARHGLKTTSEAIGKRPRDICPGEFGRLPSEQDAKMEGTQMPTKMPSSLPPENHRKTERRNDAAAAATKPIFDNCLRFIGHTST
jgi:hypothetical protein